MLDQTHAVVLGTATLVIVTDNIVVCGIEIFAEISWDEISGLISGTPEEDICAVDIAEVKTNGLMTLCRTVMELKEVVGKLRWASRFAPMSQSEDEGIKNTIVLEYEGSELKASGHGCHILRKPALNSAVLTMKKE